MWACDAEVPDAEDPVVDEMIDLEYFRTPDELAALWREHGAEAVSAWVETSPGTRSMRWWKYVAAGPRRLGGVSNPEQERLFLEHRWRFWKGLPLGPDGGLDGPEDKYETEFEYLDRLGFLLPGEVPR